MPQSSSSSSNRRAYERVEASTASACRSSDSLFVYFVSVSHALSRVSSIGRLRYPAS